MAGRADQMRASSPHSRKCSSSQSSSSRSKLRCETIERWDVSACVREARRAGRPRVRRARGHSARGVRRSCCSKVTSPRSSSRMTPFARSSDVDRGHGQPLRLKSSATSRNGSRSTVGLGAPFVASKRVLGQLHHDERLRTLACRRRLDVPGNRASRRGIALELHELDFEGTVLAVQLGERSLRTGRVMCGRSVRQLGEFAKRGMVRPSDDGPGSHWSRNHPRGPLRAGVGAGPGSMGDVFEAFDRTTDHEVAVKVSACASISPMSRCDGGFAGRARSSKRSTTRRSFACSSSGSRTTGSCIS